MNQQDTKQEIKRLEAKLKIARAKKDQKPGILHIIPKVLYTFWGMIPPK